MGDEAQRENFYRLLEENISNLAAGKKENFLYSQERYEKIENALSCEIGAKCIDGAYFKFRSLKNFKLQRVGAKDIVFCVKTKRPLLTKDELFNTIARCHAREKNTSAIMLAVIRSWV